jgi:hypothetical protein
MFLSWSGDPSHRSSGFYKLSANHSLILASYLLNINFDTMTVGHYDPFLEIASQCLLDDRTSTMSSENNAFWQSNLFASSVSSVCASDVRSSSVISSESPMSQRHRAFFVFRLNAVPLISLRRVRLLVRSPVFHTGQVGFESHTRRLFCGVVSAGRNAWL